MVNPSGYASDFIRDNIRENCERQLASAGCGFSDVFKVNVYLADLAEWSRFNAVYEKSMPAPLPVRTAVQAILLDGFRVEIEMWASNQTSASRQVLIRSLHRL